MFVEGLQLTFIKSVLHCGTRESGLQYVCMEARRENKHPVRKKREVDIANSFGRNGIGRRLYMVGATTSSQSRSCVTASCRL